MIFSFVLILLFVASEYAFEKITLIPALRKEEIVGNTVFFFKASQWTHILRK